MPVVDPILLDNPAVAARTGLVIVAEADTMPAVVWAGPVPRGGLDPAMVAAAACSGSSGHGQVPSAAVTR
jgi:hypothetical protein